MPRMRGRRHAKRGCGPWLARVNPIARLACNKKRGGCPQRRRCSKLTALAPAGAFSFEAPAEPRRRFCRGRRGCAMRDLDRTGLPVGRGKPTMSAPIVRPSGASASRRGRKRRSRLLRRAVRRRQHRHRGLACQQRGPGGGVGLYPTDRPVAASHPHHQYGRRRQYGRPLRPLIVPISTQRDRRRHQLFMVRPSAVAVLPPL
jgi:hypothetical protein